jgi:hypothetical protein
MCIFSDCNKKVVAVENTEYEYACEMESVLVTWMCATCVTQINIVSIHPPNNYMTNRITGLIVFDRRLEKWECIRCVERIWCCERDPEMSLV